MSHQHKTSLALLTDFYQLTMAYGYWKTGLAQRRAVFHLTFREHPFGGEFSIACGIATALEALANYRFTDDDLAYLATLSGSDGEALFDDPFLRLLGTSRLECDLAAVPEGTVVFPHEPLVRVRGPLWQCQLLETLLLNIINFQTLIATKAARVCMAAEGDPVLEFGLRRAQGPDGGVTASRASYIGGCAATSNVMAGKQFGIPVRGTHAHSWILAFDDEPTAFESYASALPNNCVFLVDTFNTLRGVQRAVRVGQQLRKAGHALEGIRLDSGDLAALSCQARRILDEHGFADAVIVASNDLDEHEICALKARGAQINVWGVGTKLATAYDQPALGGVYKLSAIQDESGNWIPRIKLSQEEIKVSNPGIQQVRRYRRHHELMGDLIFDESGAPVDDCGVRLADGESWRAQQYDEYEDLLVEMLEGGSPIYDAPSVDDARARARQELDRLPAGVKLLVGARPYSVFMQTEMARLKEQLIAEARGAAG